MARPSFIHRVLALTLIGLGVGAAAPPGALVPGTIMDGTGEVVIDATHTAYCMINPAIAGVSGAESFVTLGPVGSAFQQNTPGGPVLVTFPGLGEGELILNGGQTEAGFNYFSQGMALLTFTSSTAGNIAFPGSGNTLPNKNYNPVFNSYTTSFDSATNRLYVSFGIQMGPCGVAFRGAFQA